MIELDSARAYEQLHADERRIWSVPRSQPDPAVDSERVDPRHGGARVYGNICGSLDFTPRFTFERNAKVFTIGSCFAREVEEALLPLGFDVLTRDISTYAYPHGNLNRYNSAAMLQELQFASGERIFHEDSIVQVKGAYADLTSYGLFDTVREVLEHRHRTIDLFRRLREADLVIVTAGLSEAWFDRRWSHYTNVAPSEAATQEKDRFEFRALDFATTRDSLRALISLIRAQASGAHIILTVSPVPLSATFLARDVLISNCYSKAALRSAVEELYWELPYVDYFPSYEMVSLSDPGLVWEADRRHVRRGFIGEIMQAFLSSYVRGWKEFAEEEQRLAEERRRLAQERQRLEEERARWALTLRTVGQLLALDGQDFVEAAYGSILKRRTDPSGLASYLSELQRGTPKEQIIQALKSSAEGRQANARLPGYRRLLLKSRLFGNA